MKYECISFDSNNGPKNLYAEKEKDSAIEMP